MEDTYLLPNHLKKILEKNTIEKRSDNKEKFADRESIIDEKRMIRIVNIFLK